MNGLKLTAAAAAVAALPATGMAETDNPFIDPAENCAVRALSIIDLSEIKTILKTPANNTYQDKTISEDGVESIETARRTIGFYGAMDSVTVEAKIDINLGGQTDSVTFSARHDGTKSSYIDASHAEITMLFQDGAAISRKGTAYTSESKVDVKDQVHGQWVISAAQGLEASFMTCMNKDRLDGNPYTSVEIMAAPDFLAPK